MVLPTSSSPSFPSAVPPRTGGAAQVKDDGGASSESTRLLAAVESTHVASPGSRLTQRSASPAGASNPNPPAGPADPARLKITNWKKLIDFLVQTKHIQVFVFTFVFAVGIAAFAMGGGPIALAVMFSVFIIFGLVPGLIVNADKLKDVFAKNYTAEAPGTRRKEIINALLGMASTVGYTVNAALSVASIFLPFIAPVTICIVAFGVIGMGAEVTLRLRGQGLPKLDDIDRTKPWFTEFVTKKFNPVVGFTLSVGIPLAACAVLSLTNTFMVAHAMTGGAVGVVESGSAFLTFLSNHASGFITSTANFIVTSSSTILIKLCALIAWAMSDLITMYISMLNKREEVRTMREGL